MRTKHVTTRIPLDIIERIESVASKKNITISSALSQLICDHFKLNYSPEEFTSFLKVSKAILLLSTKEQINDIFYKEIGKEIVKNLTRRNDGSYKRTDDGMYYFSDTEKLRDLITEYLESING